MHPNLPLLGIVLAGGRSSRMGRCKTGLTHPGGKTFLQRAIDELSRCCDMLAVSISSEQASRPPTWSTDVHTLVDQSMEFGPSEGLLRGVEHAITNQCAGVMLFPVDLPFLPEHELRSLVDAFMEVPGQIAVAVSEQSPDRLEPLVAIYPVAMRDDLESLVSSDDRSLYRFISRSPHQTVRLSARALTNINQPEDWPTDDLRVRTP